MGGHPSNLDGLPERLGPAGCRDHPAVDLGDPGRLLLQPLHPELRAVLPHPTDLLIDPVELGGVLEAGRTGAGEPGGVTSELRRDRHLPGVDGELAERGTVQLALDHHHPVRPGQVPLKQLLSRRAAIPGGHDEPQPSLGHHCHRPDLAARAGQPPEEVLRAKPLGLKPLQVVSRGEPVPSLGQQEPPDQVGSGRRRRGPEEALRRTSAISHPPMIAELARSRLTAWHLPWPAASTRRP